MTSAADYNRQGVRLKQQGQTRAAQVSYRRAIEADPTFAEAPYNLGLLLKAEGDLHAAMECFRQTIQLRPGVAGAHFQLANTLAETDQWDAAIAGYFKAIELAPDWPAAWLNLANTYFASGETARAAACYERVLRMSPDSVEALTGMGNVAAREDRHAAAIEIFQQVLALRPGSAEALCNLGRVWRERGDLEQAIGCYRQAIAHQPGLIAAHVNLGNAYMARGAFAEACRAYEQARDRTAPTPDLQIRLGQALVRAGRHLPAARAFEQALDLAPNAPEPAINLGHLHRELGDDEQARAFYELAAHLAPSEPLHALRAAALCPLVFDGTDQLRCYRRHLREAVRRFETHPFQIDLDHVLGWLCEAPYNLQFLDGNLCPLKSALADLYARHFPQPWDVTRREGKPRVGMVVTQGHEAAFERLLAPLVRRLDSREFDVAVVASVTGAARIRAAVAADQIEIVPCPNDFKRTCETIAAARFDLLYYWEIGTDPTNYFLPFLRLAPVQCTSWGIQVTSGIPTVDYYLSSRLVEPPDAADHYREELILADSLLAYQSPCLLAKSGKNRCHFGFAESDHLYGCVQNLGKFHPDFDTPLRGILETDADAVVVAAADRNGVTAERLKARLQRTLGSRLAGRVRFLPPQRRDDYLSLLACCDVLLDPLHFGGVTTTYDGFSLDQVIVTQPGSQHRGRYTAACYAKMDLAECVASDVDDYVRRAVWIACDKDAREGIRERIRASKEALFEDSNAVRDHERILHLLLARGRSEK